MIPRAMFAALLIGCVSVPAVAQDLPNLIGTWKGSAEAVHVGPTPYRPAGEAGVTFSADPIEFTYRITEQKDHRFAGEMSGGTGTETIIGSLRHGNEDGIMLDADGQYQFTLRDSDTMDLCYSHLNPTSRVVACWTVTRTE